jgi:hypothetical protein
MIAATNMTYVNDGRAEYGAILVDELATLRIGDGNSATLHWHEFSNVTTLNAASVMAAATLIPGASSIAHETRFFARDEACAAPCDPHRNFIPWKQFIAAASDKEQQISVIFSARTRARREKVYSKTCGLFISDRDRSRLAAQGSKITRITSLTCRY